MAYKPEKKQAIIDKYRSLVEAGTTVLEAAKACGVPYFTISRWLKAAGLEVKPRAVIGATGLAAKRKKMQYSKEQQDELLDKYNQLVDQGVRVLDAAAQCGVAYLTIRRWQDARAGARPTKAKPRGRRAKAKQAPRPRSKRAATSPGPRYTLITPEGYRIEADSAKDMAEVVNRLR